MFMIVREKISLINGGSQEASAVAATWSDAGGSLEYTAALQALGYRGSRRALDIRLTDPVDFNGTGIYEFHLRSLRLYAKSFCDGCKPMAELGQMFCTLKVNATLEANSKYTLQDTSAKRREGSTHVLGIAFPASNLGAVEIPLRLVIFFYVVHMLFNILTRSSRSNEERFFTHKREGASAAVLMSKEVQRESFKEFLFPQQNMCFSKPFSLSFIMYNSNIIVLLNSILTVLTLVNSLAIQREVLWWAKYDMTFRSAITRIVINSKMVWIYLGMIKIVKYFFMKLNLPSITRKMVYNSATFVVFMLIYMIFLTAAQLDFTLDPWFSDRVDFTNDPETASAIQVFVANGFYFQRMPGILLHSFIVSVVAMVLLAITETVINKIRRQNLEQNSLYVAFASSHTAVVYDTDMMALKPYKGGAGIELPIGSVMNLKWYLKTHTTALVTTKKGEKDRVYSGGGNTTGETDDAGSVCFVRIGNDGTLHIKMKSTGKDIEHSLLYYKLIQDNQTIVIT